MAHPSSKTQFTLDAAVAADKKIAIFNQTASSTDDEGGMNITEIYDAIQNSAAEYLPLSGDTMTGNILMDGNSIENIGTPSDSAGAINKNYGDTIYGAISDVNSNTTNIANNTTAIGNKADNTTVTEIDTNVNDLITLTGVSENSTNLGTFTGDVITDNSDIKVALQELETEIEASAGATVISSGNNANGYYRVWSDGFKEQWDHEAPASGGSTAQKKRTYPISFNATSSHTVVILGMNLQNVDNNQWINCDIKNASSFTMHHSQNICWYACGY